MAFITLNNKMKGLRDFIPLNIRTVHQVSVRQASKWKRHISIQQNGEPRKTLKTAIQNMEQGKLGKRLCEQFNRRKWSISGECLGINSKFRSGLLNVHNQRDTDIASERGSSLISTCGTLQHQLAGEKIVGHPNSIRVLAVIRAISGCSIDGGYNQGGD